MRTALAGGQVDFNIGQAEGAEVIRDFIRPLAVFLDRPVPQYDCPTINDVLKPFHASVPLIPGSIRTFVLPAAFKAKHPADYAKFVSAYRATLNDADFRKWLKVNRMDGDWVGDERTAQTMRASFELLKRYKDLIKT
jgi:tripartite-type tricarboxylate transporter receptor subunit TctC